jgi:polyisoprenoid-binding protein YceI
MANRRGADRAATVVKLGVPTSSQDAASRAAISEVFHMTATLDTTTATWAIDSSHTQAEFAVKHMVFTTVKGHFSDITGTIVFDQAIWTNSTVSISIPVATVTTNDAKRDNHLKSPDFFDSENNPNITFNSTKVEKSGSDGLRVAGDLSINGVTKSVVLDTTFNGQGATPFGTTIVSFSATTKISRKDFNISFNVPLDGGGVLVGDEIKISIELEAIKQ